MVNVRDLRCRLRGGPFDHGVERSSLNHQGENPMIDTPCIVQTDAQPTACIHLVVPREEIRDVMGPGYRELMEAVAAQGVTPAGPWLNHHLRMDPGIFDFEISVPVTGPVSPVGRVGMSQLPAARVARTVYHGPYEGLPSAWAEFDAWIAAEGHTASAELWECYVAGPESGPDPATWRTELNRPVV
jgi:effector-binding domain-containing protein